MFTGVAGAIMSTWLAWSFQAPHIWTRMGTPAQGEKRMTRSHRRLLILATISALLTAPTGSFAFRLSGVVGTTTGVLTTSTCGAVTPVVYSTAVSVPATGSGNSCTRDPQCTDAGEYCAFPPGSTTGTCQASGLLSRGGIYYVAGGLVDVDVTIPQCTRVSDVPIGGTSLTGSGIDAQATPGDYTVVSSTSTTVNGQPALRQRVHIQFPNFGDGLTSTVTIQVSATVGGAVTTTSFPLAAVAAVNAAMHNSVSETRVRNGFVTSLYHKFGDYEEVWENGELKAHRPDWSRQPVFVTPNKYYYISSDILIGTGSVMFTMHFKTPKCGETDVYAAGWFKLVPAGDGFDLQWIEGPRVATDSGVFCNLLGSIWELVAGDLFDEAALADEIGRSVASGFTVDEGNHKAICPGCRVVDIQISNGRIDFYTLPPIERVRLNVSTQRYTDVTADPTQGLALPAGMYAPIAAGGLYESCHAVGSSPATCSPKYNVDMDGLFNWWGSDVPVPNPIAYNQYGVAAVLGGRQHAWERLEGLTRDITLLPEKSFPAGALLARRTPTSVWFPTTRALVTNGCVMPPNTSAVYRVSFGVNDMPTVPGAGGPPTRGKLDVTVLLAFDAAQSATLFSSSPTCKAAPSTSGIVSGTTGTLLLAP
jgi:hypothetical protein